MLQPYPLQGLASRLLKLCYRCLLLMLSVGFPTFSKHLPLLLDYLSTTPYRSLTELNMSRVCFGPPYQDGLVLLLNDRHIMLHTINLGQVLDGMPAINLGQVLDGYPRERVLS
jgi:hypothetical protein